MIKSEKKYIGKKSFARKLGIPASYLYRAVRELGLDASHGFADYTDKEINLICGLDFIKKYFANKAERQAQEEKWKKEREAQEEKWKKEREDFERAIFERKNTHVETQNVIREQATQIYNKLEYLCDLLIYIHNVDVEFFEEWRGSENDN